MAEYHFQSCTIKNGRAKENTLLRTTVAQALLCLLRHNFFHNACNKLFAIRKFKLAFSLALLLALEDSCAILSANLSDQQILKSFQESAQRSYGKAHQAG